jgi:hypothetical protein
VRAAQVQVSRFKWAYFRAAIRGIRVFVPFVFSLAAAIACGAGSLDATITPEPNATSSPIPSPMPSPATTVAPPTAIALPTATGPAEIDLSGRYSAVGTNFDGTAYRGRAEIIRYGDGYQIEWIFGEGGQTGTGTLDGNTFTVRWQALDNSSQGDAVYTLQPNGTLTGTWTIDGATGQGTETLAPNE